MDDFARRFAEQVRAERLEEEEKRKTFLLHEQIKTAKGVSVWESVRDQLVAGCKAINRETGEEFFRIEETKSTHFRAVGPNSRELFLEFDSDAHSIKYRIGVEKGEYAMGVDYEGNVFLTLPNPDRYIDFMPESIAQSLLEMARK